MACFSCPAIPARSIPAECILDREGKGRFKAFSAGSHPKKQVHPLALHLLKKMHYPTAGLRSKSWEEFARADAPRLDFVFTVCDNAANEPCPVWPGQPMTAHWGVPDPAAVEGTEEEVQKAFRGAFFLVDRRISLFLSLRLAPIDRLALQGGLRNT